MKLFVIGHAQHGKDTAANMLADNLGLRAMDSSMFACEKAVYPFTRGYKNPQECWEDRRNNRTFWYDRISEYNETDPCRLSRELFLENDIYVGIRSRKEFLAAKDLAHLSIWIDSSDRKKKESISSMSILRSDADIVIDNNGTIECLQEKIDRLCYLLLLGN